MRRIYKKILCPIDFSPYSGAALRNAASLVKLFDAELIIVNIITNPALAVLPTPRRAVIMPTFEVPILETALKKAEEMVKEFADEHIPGTSCDIFVRDYEHVYQGILAYAEELDIDLIVMSTHGRTGAKRLLMGSVAENVVRKAPCSVLVVRAPLL